MYDLISYATCFKREGEEEIRERGFCAFFPLPSPFLLLPRRLIADEILPAVPSDVCMDRSDAYAHHFEIEDLHNNTQRYY